MDDGSGHPICPRCQASGLMIGLDFNYLSGPAQCSSCDWTSAEPATIGECLQCGVRFRDDEAIEEELTQFLIPRLNPSAFIDLDE